MTKWNSTSLLTYYKLSHYEFICYIYMAHTLDGLIAYFAA